MSIREMVNNIYNKFFNKKQKQKLLEEKIDKITEKKYQRAVNSGKTYRCSNERLKEIIRKRVVENEKKKSFKKKLRGAVVGAAALLTVTGTVGALNKDNKGVELPTTPEITTQVGTTSTKTDIDETQKDKMNINDIIDMYNEKYPDTTITKSDLGIIKQDNVGYLVKEKTKDGDTKYIENPWNKEGLKENQEYIYSDSYKGGYVLIANGNVIASVANVENKISNVDVKRISNGKKEYLSSEKYYEFEEPDKAMEPLENFYKERLEQLRQNER